jgi:hypothetical protein
VAAYARYGFEDEQVKPRLELSWMRANGRGLRLFAEREYYDAGDVGERSGLINSIAAQEFGSDLTEPFDVRAAGVAVELGRMAGMTWQLAGSYEEHRPVRVVASPSRGEYEPVIPALHADAGRFALSFERPTVLGFGGTEIRAAGELRGMVFNPRGEPEQRSAVRLFVDVGIERPFAAHRLVLRTTIAAVEGNGALPPQELVYLGGPVSGPGYRFHELVAELGASQRLEWRMPMPFLPVPLGRFGEAPGRMTLAPFAHAVFLARRAGDRGAGWYPSLGAGALLFFDALRFDFARGLRDGKWTFSVDVTPELWRVL